MAGSADWEDTQRMEVEEVQFPVATDSFLELEDRFTRAPAELSY